MALIRHAIIFLTIALGATAPAQKPDAPGAATGDVGDALPPDFRGRITYQGTHGATLDRGGRRGSREYGGALTVEQTFDGNAVTGRFSRTGGINSGTMSGTRNGSRCRLFEERAGDVIEGECTRTGFSATARSQGSRNAMAARFDAQATQVVDSRVVTQVRPAPSAPRSAPLIAASSQGVSNIAEYERRLARRSQVFARYTRSQLIRCVAVISYYLVEMEDQQGQSTAVRAKDDLTVDIFMYISRRWGSSSEALGDEALAVITNGRNYPDNSGNARADLEQCREIDRLAGVG